MREIVSFRVTMPVEGDLPFVLFQPDLLEFELTLTKGKRNEIYYAKSW